MKVVIRYPKRREVQIPGPRKLRDVLKELSINPEGVVVLQGRDLLTRDANIKDDDTIEIISAISGGA